MEIGLVRPGFNYICGNGHELFIEVRPHPRASHLRLKVIDGAAIMSGPAAYHIRDFKKFTSFIKNNEEWLLRTIANTPLPYILEDGHNFPFRGAPVTIRMDETRPRNPVLDGDILNIGGMKEHIGPRIIRWLKEEARNHLPGDVMSYCRRARIRPPERIEFSNARRRWGSCSYSRIIRLNWRLILMPVWVSDSIIAHEVAHLSHMNHSPQFYALLDDLYEGDRKRADRWLKANGQKIALVGR